MQVGAGGRAALVGARERSPHAARRAVLGSLIGALAARLRGIQHPFRAPWLNVTPPSAPRNRGQQRPPSQQRHFTGAQAMQARGRSKRPHRAVERLGHFAGADQV